LGHVSFHLIEEIVDQLRHIHETRTVHQNRPANRVKPAAIQQRV
jgi:hypothetical protein